jgi:hypothetical protein
MARGVKVLNAVADQLTLFKGKYVTSDHMVVCSSNSGCKVSSIADLRTILRPETLASKVVLRHFSATLDPS